MDISVKPEENGNEDKQHLQAHFKLANMKSVKPTVPIAATDLHAMLRMQPAATSVTGGSASLANQFPVDAGKELDDLTKAIEPPETKGAADESQIVAHRSPSYIPTSPNENERRGEPDEDMKPPETGVAVERGDQNSEELIKDGEPLKIEGAVEAVDGKLEHLVAEEVIHEPTTEMNQEHMEIDGVVEVVDGKPEHLVAEAEEVSNERTIDMNQEHPEIDGVVEDGKLEHVVAEEVLNEPT